GPQRPSGVGDAGRAEQGRGELVLAIDQVLAVLAGEHEADHHVAEHPAVEVGEHGAQPVGPDPIEQQARLHARSIPRRPAHASLAYPASGGGGATSGYFILASWPSMRFFWAGSLVSDSAFWYSAIAAALSPLASSASARLSCAFHDSG